NPGTDRLRIVGDTEIASNHEINGANFSAVTGVDGGAYVGCMLEYVRSTGIMQVFGCTGVTIHQCEPRNFGGMGIQVGNSLARITNCNFGTGVVHIAITATTVSRVFSRNNIGQATSYGLYASEGSTIFKFGTQPTGSAENEHIYDAGEIKSQDRGELVISGQDVVPAVYGENITKGSPIVVKNVFDPTKLPNPSTLPTGTGYSCTFAPNGTYLAVAHSSSPYITIYKRSGDTFTKLANPGTLPSGTSRGCAFDSTGTYLAVEIGKRRV